MNNQKGMRGKYRKQEQSKTTNQKSTKSQRKQHKKGRWSIESGQRRWMKGQACEMEVGLEIMADQSTKTESVELEKNRAEQRGQGRSSKAGSQSGAGTVGH